MHADVKIKEQLAGISSCLLLCGYWELNLSLAANAITH